MPIAACRSWLAASAGRRGCGALAHVQAVPQLAAQAPNSHWPIHRTHIPAPTTPTMRTKSERRKWADITYLVRSGNTRRTVVPIRAAIPAGAAPSSTRLDRSDEYLFGRSPSASADPGKSACETRATDISEAIRARRRAAARRSLPGAAPASRLRAPPRRPGDHRAGRSPGSSCCASRPSSRARA